MQNFILSPAHRYRSFFVIELNMQVTVENLDGHTSTIEIEPSDDSEAVAAKIEAKTGIDRSAQRLIFQGKKLGGSSKTMGEFGIHNGSKIGIIHRGPFPRPSQ